MRVLRTLPRARIVSSSQIGEAIRELQDAVREIQTLHVGPGLEMSKGATYGIAFSAAMSRMSDGAVIGAEGATAYYYLNEIFKADTAAPGSPTYTYDGTDGKIKVTHPVAGSADVLQKTTFAGAGTVSIGATTTMDFDATGHYADGVQTITITGTPTATTAGAGWDGGETYHYRAGAAASVILGSTDWRNKIILCVYGVTPTDPSTTYNVTAEATVASPTTIADIFSGVGAIYTLQVNTSGQLVLVSSGASASGIEFTIAYRERQAEVVFS